jgi:SAM-dependent methyltransferase
MGTPYDFGKTSSDYGRYRAGFPARFFDTLFQSGKVKPGDRVLDLGTGTGTLARGFARRGCRVTALDISRELVVEARRLDREAGVAIRYVEAPAERTGLPSGSFDVVTAGQCWHWFDRDRAALEARRILKSHGRIIIAHFDWVPLPGNVVEATEQLIAENNPRWTLYGSSGINPQWFADLAIARFEAIELLSFYEAVRYTHEGWRGRIRASAGVGASLPPEGVERFDKAHAKLLIERFPSDPLDVPHRVWAVMARS